MKEKHLFITIISMVILFLALPTTAFAEGENTIKMGFGISEGDTVYFGKYTENSVDYNVPWIVLPSETLSEVSTSITTKLPLLSKYLLGNGKIQLGTRGHYAGGLLEGIMGDIYSGFNIKEQNLVATTTLIGNSIFSGDDNLTNQKLFPLSYTEATSLVEGSSVLRATQISSPNESASFWWLRTFNSGVGEYGVNGNGRLQDMQMYLPEGVRPAFNLDSSFVLFTSAAAGGKSNVDAGLTTVSTTSADEWKLTIYDNSRNSFIASLNGTKGTVSNPVIAGQNIEVNFSGAQTGTNEYVSVMLVDNSNNILYYGHIANNRASNTAQTLTIPADLAAGTYTLKIFNEQRNGDYKTDYASAFRNVQLTVIVPVAPLTAAYDKYTDTLGLDFALTPGVYTLSAIRRGGNMLVEGSEYTTTSSGVTIRPEYLQMLAVGTHTLTFDYGLTPNPIVTITISDTSPEVGLGITNIARTNTTGVVDTYTITYTDGSTSTFTVANGTNGTDGTNGLTPFIGLNGNWWVGETDTEVKATGMSGKEIELHTDTDSGYIQWRYKGDITWQNLIALSLLSGTDGVSGQDGMNGREIELQTTSTHIQWRHKGETTWNNLVILSDFAGKDGVAGKDGKDGTVGATGKDGKDGTAGKDGVDISSIEKTGSNGNKDIYTITLTDGTISTFTVTNGEKGISISKVIINNEGDLIVTLSNGDELNAGNISSVITTSQSDKSSTDLFARVGALIALLANVGWIIPLINKRKH